MATQKDLDVLKQKLSDLDAKLKSMGGGSAQRNPRFDLAMANQNYANLMREQQARIAAQGQYTKGRLMGAPSGQGGLGGLTADQANIPADQRRILDDLMARQQVDIAANEAKRQDFLKTQKPVGGSMAGPIYGSLAGNILANGAPATMSPDQLNAMRMQQYNQFLSQGMQNSNTMNQGGMANFANMQAGAPTMQPTIPLPQLRGVTAQPRNLPRPSQPKGFRSPIGRSAF